MSTRVYGCSDNLLEFEGDFRGEVECYDATGDSPVLVILSDGTLLEMKYGKGHRGIWSVSLLNKGSLFDRIDQCDDEDADLYSDVAHFGSGIKWAYAATEWGVVS